MRIAAIGRDAHLSTAYSVIEIYVMATSIFPIFCLGVVLHLHWVHMLRHFASGYNVTSRGLQASDQLMFRGHFRLHMVKQSCGMWCSPLGLLPLIIPFPVRWFVWVDDMVAIIEVDMSCS